MVTMGVLERAKRASGLSHSEVRPYICVNCEAQFDVQYHTCPACGKYDVRRAKWMDADGADR
ncbi:hypothetical protein [Halosimplex amylolyticum]|uniref:hypothetical protein n=1 Tax=Halosimplex amylolyticum TaxID=3396616 RepID=UPI003F55464B